MPDFKGRHFTADIILWAVRWYCKYGISYRELAEMLLERGVTVNHTTLYRWVQRYAPEIERRLRWCWKPGWSTSWQVDETYGVPGVQGEHGSLNEPRVYLKYTSAVAGANLCLWLCLVVQAYESERQ